MGTVLWRAKDAFVLWLKYGAWWHGEGSYMRFGLRTAWQMAGDIQEFRQFPTGEEHHRHRPAQDGDGLYRCLDCKKELSV